MRSACVITTLPIIAPARVPGNTSAPRVPLRASASTSSACRDSGTRRDFAVFVVSAGLTHTAPSRSNCSHVARRTSTCRDAVGAVNRIARFVEGAQFVASILASAPQTSKKCSAGKCFGPPTRFGSRRRTVPTGGALGAELRDPRPLQHRRDRRARHLDRRMLARKRERARGPVEFTVHCRCDRETTMRTRTLIGALAAVLSAAAHGGERGDAAAGPQFRIAAGAEVTSEQSVYVQGGAVVTVLPGLYALWGRFYVRGPALGVYLLGGGDWTVSTGIFLDLEDTDRGDSPQLADMTELENGLLGEFVASYDTGWGRAGLQGRGRHQRPARRLPCEAGLWLSACSRPLGGGAERRLSSGAARRSTNTTSA